MSMRRFVSKINGLALTAAPVGNRRLLERTSLYFVPIYLFCQFCSNHYFFGLRNNMIDICIRSPLVK